MICPLPRCTGPQAFFLCPLFAAVLAPFSVTCFRAADVLIHSLSNICLLPFPLVYYYNAHIRLKAGDGNNPMGTEFRAQGAKAQLHAAWNSGVQLGFDGAFCIFFVGSPGRAIEIPRQQKVEFTWAGGCCVRTLFVWGI